MHTPPRPLPAHTRFGPVFVLGFARSGTSLTCRLLLDHLGVNFGTESQFIARIHRHLGQYGDLRDDARLRRLFEDMSRERFFARTRQNFGFVFDIDRAMREIPARTYAGALRTVFEQFAATQGHARWGDKTPEYSHHLPLLNELFPDAQFVHIVRDGRDAAASIFKTSFGAKTALEAARDWANSVDRIQRFGRSLPRERYLEIHYEELLGSPADTLLRVARFLGVANRAETIAFAARRLQAQVRQDNSHKWRDGALPPRELALFEAIAGDQLAALGYPLSGQHRRRVGRLEAAGWTALGVYRRLTNRHYWADNAYRLSLRLRHAGFAKPRLASWL